MREALRRVAGLCLLAGVAAAGGCEGPAPAPETVDRSGQGRNPGGGSPAVYQGVHRREIRHLLGRAAGWRTSRDGRTDGGVPPVVPIHPGCIRDSYVAAAVQYAWAAESYYRLGNSAAARMAAAVRWDLDRADRLCGGGGQEGADGCESLGLWGCPAPL